MTRHFPLLIARGCLAILVLAVVAALYFLININAFALLAERTLGLPIASTLESENKQFV